ncbi:MAG TPA: response regulator, partial [Myxococcota bacterium]|nr:response regulator [Myxococcota bacterium]
QLYIPRTDVVSEAPEDGESIALATGRGESVLVVEDDPALRNMIVSFLQKLGYAVRAASNGSEALAIAQRAGSIDLLLSDVILPGDYSGPELADEIAARVPAIRILLMSGYAADALERRATSARYATPLQKPFSMGKLAQEIRAALSA